MTNFPSLQEIKKINMQLEKSIASRPLPENASDLDKLKFEVCKIFVVYKNKHNITQRTLAEKLGIDETLVNKILHYHLDEFTIDELIKCLSEIYSKINLKIDVA